MTPLRRGTRRALLSVAAVPVVAVAVLGAEIQLARTGPDLPDDTPLDHDGHLGGSGPGLRMVWVGDSTAAGVGATSPERAIPRRVAAALDRSVDVVSRAVSGARVQDVVNGQIHDLDALRPDVVLVSIGSNDAVHLTSRAHFRSAYGDLVGSVPEGALLVVLGVPDMGAPPRLAQPLRALAGLRGRQLDAVVRDVVEGLSAVYVDIAGETGPVMRSDTARYFAQDRYHPSDDGYELWAEAVLRQLEPALDARRPARRKEVVVAHR